MWDTERPAEREISSNCGIGRGAEETWAETAATSRKKTEMRIRLGAIVACRVLRYCEMGYYCDVELGQKIPMKMRRLFGWAGVLCALVGLPLIAQSASPSDGSSHKSLPLRIIVVSTASEAAQILAKLKNGEDFAVLAKEKSTDPTADSGGYMGITDPAMLRPELREALTNVKAGEISFIAHISAGFAILKILGQNEISEEESSNRDRTAALSAIGSIKYTPNVSGIGEAESALFRSPKPPGWGQDLKQICESRKQTLTNATKRMEDLLAPSNVATLDSQPPVDVTQEYYALGELYAYPGEMDKAITQYRKALEFANAKSPAVLPQIEEEIGIAYLHKSEMDNGIYHGQGNQCVFPLRPQMAFAKKDDSRRAIEDLEKYLRQVPYDLSARCLLNYSYMTVGEYPAGVPPKLLIPPSTFESKEDAPRFVDVAAAAGLHDFSMAGGVIVDDFENNGLLDVVTSSMNMCQHLHYFHNNGDRTIPDPSEQPALIGQLVG